ncbi:MAG: hypothetical protein HY268_25245 [Deltaproteobacteria bacterium]|nr:hypothetical protein [Deltaproteobacteria bacterium]
MSQRRFVRTLILLGVFTVCLSSVTARAFDLYLSPRLGISLTTLQSSLRQVGGSLVFTPRPGSQHGTQEARLPDDAGIVQVGGDKENLTTVVLWLPVGATGKLAGAKAQSYLDAFVRLFAPESEVVLRWIPQVLERAVADSGGGPHLESQLLDKHQFKTMYVPTLSPPMLSLTVVTAVGQAPSLE